MRHSIRFQPQLGQISIDDLELPLQARDRITKILRGLQAIYTAPELLQDVLHILEEMAGGSQKMRTGRPGMRLWEILVLGSLRLGLNTDYDHLQNLAHYHMAIRIMLQFGPFDTIRPYKLQTLKDNLRLFTPEILARINAAVVRAGHKCFLRGEAELKGRCDSFVVETNVHYPTDAHLLWDSVRKALELSCHAAQKHGIAGFRKTRHHLRCVKKAWRQFQQAKKNDTRRRAAAESYLFLAQQQLNRVRETLPLFSATGLSTKDLEEIRNYLQYGDMLADQFRRRVLDGQKIPQAEKIFSVFEPHTEWISKGKTGVPVELGLKVCILEDQHGFILHHQVMKKKMDTDVAVSMVDGARSDFPGLATCSFDKGFHSPENQVELAERLRKVVLPKKGRRNEVELERERDAEFVKLRRKHSAVESGIRALEVHGLDRCPDHGLAGFEKYVAMAVLARNIHRLGALLLERDLRRLGRKKLRRGKPRLAA